MTYPKAPETRIIGPVSDGSSQDVAIFEFLAQAFSRPGSNPSLQAGLKQCLDVGVAFEPTSLHSLAIRLSERSSVGSNARLPLSAETPSLGDIVIVAAQPLAYQPSGGPHVYGVLGFAYYNDACVTDPWGNVGETYQAVVPPPPTFSRIHDLHHVHVSQAFGPLWGHGS